MVWGVGSGEGGGRVERRRAVVCLQESESEVSGAQAGEQISLQAIALG